MSTAYRRSGTWVSTLAWVILLLLVGAALAVWGLSRWEAGARFLGIAPKPNVATSAAAQPIIAPVTPIADPADAARLTSLEKRVQGVENATQRNAGSVGRADALLVAFASRRAIDRGVQLGYLESLLSERFGAQDPRAVATIITASHSPVTLDQLTSDYGRLQDQLGRGPPDEGLWQGFKRELGSIVSVRHSTAPPAGLDARYNHALERLEQGQVDVALAETMRLPGAQRASAWIGEARRYVIAHRALDEIESAALLGGGR